MKTLGSNEFISPSPFQPDDDFSEEEANEDIDSVEERGEWTLKST